MGQSGGGWPPPAWLPEAERLWLAGYRYNQIAAAVGVSRERVRQVKSRLPPRPWRPISQLGETYPTIRGWAAAGYLTLSPAGLVIPAEVAAARRQLCNRRCEYPGCRNRIGDANLHTRFCVDCSAEAERYNYPVKTAEQKRKHVESVERWRAAHPAEAQKIQANANAAYRKRQRELKKQLQPRPVRRTTS